MRVFVFLLILVNLLFLAWTQGYLGPSSNPDAFRMQQQLLADRVKIVARDEPPAVAPKAEPVAKAPEVKPEPVCVMLKDLAVADADLFESLLAEKLTAFKAVRTTNPGSSSYWVAIPPLANKQEVDNKTAELKKLRITEFFVVQESGPNNRAISLGLFSKRDVADDYLEKLRSKGVKSAKVFERNNKAASASLEIRGPGDQVAMLRQSIADHLPVGKPVDCETPAPASP